MNPTEIEFALRDLVAKPYDPELFPYELIGIFNASKVTVSRLRNGQTNAAKQPGDVLWKTKVFFRSANPRDDVGAIADVLAADPLTAKHKPRFILVTNGEQFHARDTQLDDTLNVEYALLDEKSDFFLPLAGYERRSDVEEHPADIKAAKKLKKLYDAILVANPTWTTGHHSHELNLLMTRLLFCFYAEKTGIFDTPKTFSNTLTQHTNEEGGEVAPLLDRLFRIMNLEEGKRPGSIPAVEKKFPYVNGSLFEDTVEIPQFTRTARRQMLECGDLDWTTINPDIFGSMIQTISQDGTRSDLGMHYTSVPNIMKVLQPLFLDDLHDAYERSKDSVPKLEALLGRLSKIRVFDPACGSGNFLIIAYKEMRKLEIEILKRIGEVASKAPLRLSGISLQNFYGIDLVDFACETAKLSLWIAEHQMNSLFRDIFGSARATLPLGKIHTISNGNALRVDWLSVCPRDDTSETYICGNPPFQGSIYHTLDQQNDLVAVYAKIGVATRELDYVAGWFAKGALYLASSERTALALVSTNSLFQGRQTALLWPAIFGMGLEFFFAYSTFKWSNNAALNAGVACNIVGLRKTASGVKRIFSAENVQAASDINVYLAGVRASIVSETPSPISGLPALISGNQPCDAGYLLLSPAERSKLLSEYPEARPLIRNYRGAKDFLYGLDRSCIWIPDDALDLALSIRPIRERIDAVRNDRLTRGGTTKQAAKFPHRFRYITYRGGATLLIPKTSSELREYFTIGHFDKDTIVNDSAFTIYEPPSYLFAILSSRLHMIWAEAVSGRLENRLRYSSTLVYNTFPMPSVSEEQMRSLADRTREIIKSRSRHVGKTIAYLYAPQTMPEDLREAHRANDSYLEEIIYGRGFRDDTQRLEHLFAMHERMLARKMNGQDLFGDHNAGKRK
jgi:hypothetical protein